MIDVAASAGALVLLAPAFGLLTLAIRVAEGGPAVYRAPRLGRRGRTFEMWKFRTMVMNAPDLRNPDGSTYSGLDDPRITPLGRWLRQTSLDELPQLWNVLRGDMSLVGPRPDLPDQSRHYSADDWRRLEVRPGITGLAQVSGRNDLPWSERRALDLRYVETMSFALDLRILLRTVPGVARSRGVFGQQSTNVRHESHRH
jgi:lipopolysaccharide/colanic/teichoic acid biosynthesis glycosyltransferase